MIDELAVMKTCINVVTPLFEASNKELPGVRTPVTRYMSRSIQRTDKDDLPVADAESMHKMSLTQDGRDAISVLETILLAVKNTSEVLPYPISRLVMYVGVPVVRNGNNGPFYAISSKVNLGKGPSHWERWCMLVKTNALTKYLGGRLTGSMPMKAIMSITEEMNVTQLVETKNVQKYNELLNITVNVA